MSLYTRTERKKNLWIPITDADFNVNFKVPFMLFTEEGGLLLVDSIDTMFDYADDENFYDRDLQALTEDGKELFRNWYFAYMQIDNTFLKTIEPFACQCLEAAKLDHERPNLFVMFNNGRMEVLDHFDFDTNGSLLRYDSTLRKLKDPESTMKFFVNIDRINATSPRLLFSSSAS